jgi:hypothetical protein
MHTKMKKDVDGKEREEVNLLEEAQTLLLGGDNVDITETKEPDEQRKKLINEVVSEEVASSTHIWWLNGEAEEHGIIRGLIT